MKKINEDDYAGFVVECSSFKMNGSLKLCMKVFNERQGQCTVYGIKHNGDRAVIESKS